MVFGEIIAVYSENHTKHIYTLCGQNTDYWLLKEVVHIVTTGLWRVWSLEIFLSLSGGCPNDIMQLATVASFPYSSRFTIPVLRMRLIDLFQFRIISENMNHRQTVGLLGRVINSSQGLYLQRTTQHRQTRINIHALRGIRTRDPVYERSRPAS
jgi:hypothetical protein